MIKMISRIKDKYMNEKLDFRAQIFNMLALTGMVLGVDIAISCVITNAGMVNIAVNLADAGKDVQFNLPQGTITLDTESATSIAEQITGVNVTISLKAVSRSSLTAAQKEAVGPDDLVFDISVASGTQTIHNFDGTTSRFGDVAIGQWYSAAVEWAADKGIVSGVDNGKPGDLFDPKGVVTRAEVATIFTKFLECLEK